ncbi:hypothetical protein JOL79_27690 [Microbispora sp. RL4-1S]|uniref:Uncharacterized protein n=1 Tax=Microbispora oryzae TaxID=2806554 RepID=A0A940WUT2_9ACTN|nr:hypothetical protein [Microbispora oryzae]MBP2707571.1 hypothetical protein [Microbispora oryzae]
MTRSEFDDIRAHIAAEAGHPSELLELARILLDDLEQIRMREAALRSYYLGLLTAARATVAADDQGDAAPLTFLRHELAKHGQLPAGDQVQRILSDARTAQALLDHAEETPPRMGAPKGRVPRCGGVSRTVRG